MPAQTAPQPEDQGTAEDTIPAHPNVPKTWAVVLALASVVTAGLLGVVIGWGLADTGCTGECQTAKAAGAVIGGAIAAAGAGVVAVLVLRAMAEWTHHLPDSSVGNEDTGGPVGIEGP